MTEEQKEEIIYKEKIDPWLCMPLLGDVENLKNYSRDKVKLNGKYHTTINGFQPLMRHPIMFPQYSEFREAVTEQLKKHIDRPFFYSRSWFVSYDKNGRQLEHNHEGFNVDFTGVVCLFNHKDSGAFCTMNKKIQLEQGDLIFFDSKITHWTDLALLPKSIISFDCQYKNE